MCISLILKENTMLEYNLQSIFKARGIDKPYSYLVHIGFTPHTATRLTTNSSLVLNLKHIEKLCLHLNCEPNDLLIWTPDKNTMLPDNHALQNLKANTEAINLELIRSLPFKQLKELADKVSEQNQG